MSITNSSAISEGENVSEIQSLTLRVRDLSQSVDWWNVLMIWSLVFVVVAAVTVVVTTRVVITRSKKLADAQADLIQAKDKQLALDLRDKDLKIAQADERAGTANKKAGDANERASANEKEAAQLRKIAEDERLARVKIEESIQPRSLDQLRVQKELEQFAGASAIVETLSEFEPRRTAELIASTLRNSGWKVPEVVVRHDTGSAFMMDFIRSGVTIQRASPDFEGMGRLPPGEARNVFIAAFKRLGQAAESLKQCLNDNGIFTLEEPPSGIPNVIRVRVSLKPIPGEMQGGQMRGNIILVEPGAPPMKVGIAPAEPAKKKP